MRCTSSVSAPISLWDFLGIPGRLVSSTQQTVTTTSTSRASTSTSTSTRNVLKYRSSRPTSTSTCTSHAIVQVPVPVPVLRVHVPVRVPVLHRPVCHRTSRGFQADLYQVLNIQLPVPIPTVQVPVQVPVAVQEDSRVQVLCMVLLAATPCDAVLDVVVVGRSCSRCRMLQLLRRCSDDVTRFAWIKVKRKREQASHWATWLQERTVMGNS